VRAGTGGMAFSGEVSGDTTPCISDILNVSKDCKMCEETGNPKNGKYEQRIGSISCELSLLTSMPRQPCDAIDSLRAEVQVSR
jgi:hypothetical protein